MRVPINPPSHSTTPQIHSNKHHNAYNGAAHLPLAVSVKRACRPYMRPRPRAHPLYAVTLYYEHNRACTIIRSRNHFDDLERGLPGIRGPKCTTEEPSGVHPLELQKLLQKAVEKCPGEVALEWFLRRRIGDCRW